MARTKEQVRKAVFGKLRSLRRKLHAQGVPCVHARSVLTHDDGTSGFAVTYKATGDNGDMNLLPHVSIRTAEGTEDFDYLTFGQGMARIRQLFQAHNGVATSDIHQ